MPHLSDAALELLKRCRVKAVRASEVDGEVGRELEAEGLAVRCRPFVGDPEYRPTALGWKLLEVVDRMEPSAPSHG